MIPTQMSCTFEVENVQVTCLTDPNLSKVSDTSLIPVPTAGQILQGQLWNDTPEIQCLQEQ